jgi:hypothetical protein
LLILLDVIVGDGCGPCEAAENWVYPDGEDHQKKDHIDEGLPLQYHVSVWEAGYITMRMSSK